MNRLLRVWGQRLLLAALLKLVFFASFGTIRGQNTELVIPLLFHGGTIAKVGDFRWESTLYFNNNGSLVPLTVGFYEQNGTPLSVELVTIVPPGSVAQTIPPDSVQVFDVEGGKSPAFKLTSSFGGQIKVFWAALAMPSTATKLTYAFDFKLLGLVREATGVEFLDSGQITRAVKSKAATVHPVQIGPAPGFNQRKPVLAMVNKGSNVANVTVTVYDSEGNSHGSFSVNVPVMNQVMEFLDGRFPGLSLDSARATVISSVDVWLSALQFLNGSSVPVEITDGIFIPNQAPQVNLENPPVTVTTALFLVSGWAVDPDGTLASVELTVDNGAVTTVPLNINRQDVKDFFASLGKTVQLNSGFAKEVGPLTNGPHTAKVKITDSAGATTEVSKTFTVNRPAVVPLAGEYYGPIDPLTSTPPGVADGQSRFYVRVIQAGPNEFLVDRWDALGFVDQCDGGTQRTSFAIITPSSPQAVVDGSFSFTSACGPKTAIFETPNRIRLVSNTSAVCRSNNNPLQPCQGIKIVGIATRSQ